MNARTTALFLFLSLLWLQLFWALAPTWNDGTYYDYGWLVAPIALIFFCRRWQEFDFKVSPSSSVSPARRWLWLPIVLALLALTPIRLIQHVDLYWRLPLWTHAGIVFLVSHLLLVLVYGWRVSRALLPATLFALLALPIPGFLEKVLVDGLTHQVVTLASASLPFLGYPVDVAGNSLLVNGELLDVAEGCSGIRSFQSSAMAGVCLGEIVRLSIVRRLLLVFAGLALAIFCNTGRIVILARIAHDHGREASDAAHDMVGFWVLILTYGGLSLCAWALVLLRKQPAVSVKTVSSHA